ncbi:type II secretion system F family protein [Sulfitobacter sp. PR48]|uniref:type II secretion system F family protein n=1 Tax=unclassified Sulfitobacter TaxID=196795 RepID=UPI0022AF8841|nr:MULTISPECIES: type II secretion system F family protein [unclassified Sulfitobacter]MCZ4255412.1 type II secretion system F family protein [Sulfitobacter sp. G21635-S1]MDD9719818.1 type II secretion system F family protein [Sulfitobacter sp. PR48]
MRAYAYVAYTKAGKRKSGTVIADTEAHAAAQLAEKGLFVSELNERRNRTTSGLFSGQRRTTLSPDLQAVFTRQMAVLLGAELPVDEALEAVRQGGHPSLDAVAARARADLMDGSTLSDALRRTQAGFAPYYVASVRAGETAGNLAGVFNELADHLENQGVDKAQISTALIYPAFVAAVALLVCAILMVNVAPEIVAMYELSDQPLPSITQVVLGISNWIQANFTILLIGLACLVAFGFASGRVPAIRAQRDKLFLRLPLVGRFMRLSAAVQYLRTLALVLSSRNTVPVAIQNASEVLDVARFQQEAAQVSLAISRGETMSQALRALTIIPPVARQLIQAGEASVRLASMTERSAVLVENGLSTERKRIAALLEPALMMLVGAMVLVIVLAVLLPIFDLQAVVAG